MPRLASAWIRASSRPCVTQTSGAPTSSTVRFSSGQSAWSLITSGSSTPRSRARWRTRIQPDATATTGSARRRAQRSATAEGGASTIAPRSAALSATVAGRSSPSGTPSSSYRRHSPSERAVEVDRPVPPRFPQQRDHPLALAERVAADDVGPLREQLHRAQQPRDLAGGRRVAEDRQAEGRFRHEHVAGHAARRARRWDRASACSRPTPRPGFPAIPGTPAPSRARARPGPAGC